MNEINNILESSGWDILREIDIEFYENLYLMRGLNPPIGIVSKIIKNIGNLNIEFIDRHGIHDVFNTNIENAFNDTNNKILSLLKEIVGFSLYPIGLINHENCLVFINSEGIYYMLVERTLFQIGESIYQVLENAINKSEIIKVGILF